MIKEVERLKRGSSKSLKKKTLINDSVHGHIEVKPYNIDCVFKYIAAKMMI